MTCTLCSLGDPPGCDACLGASDEPTGEPAPSIVYRIVHVPSGEWYVGKHKLPAGWLDPFEDDGYPFNDGDKKGRTRLAAKLAKRPRNEFRKDVLAVLPNEESALWLEAGLVGPEQVRNRRCLNCCEGGRGPLGLSEEAESRRRKAISAGNHRRYEDPAEREKHGAGTRRFYSDPAARARTGEQSRKRYEDPEYKARCDAAVAESSRRPEVRAKKSKTLRARLARLSTEERRARMAATNTPEARAKRSARQLKRYANETPDQKAARRQAISEGKRRAKAERARVQREVQMILAALIVNKYAA